MRPRRPARLRHVADLGWPIEVNFMDVDSGQPERRQEADQRAADAADRFGIPQDYLQDRLHDGGVLDLVLKPDRLWMRVSDLEYQELAHRLLLRLGRNAWPADMPVLYDFTECEFVATYHVADNGDLIPAAPGKVERKSREFLYTSVLSSEGPLTWACVLWLKRPRFNYQKQAAIVVVRSASPKIEEQHREVWERTLGKEWLWVYDRYHEVYQTVTLVQPNANAFLDSIGVAPPAETSPSWTSSADTPA